jgi:hypothetical protein
MTQEEFVYPSCDGPLAAAYGGLFESVFVVLHPFVGVPPELAWSATRSYPGDAQIRDQGCKFSWTELIARTSLNSCARVNQALLTSIGSLDAHLAEPASAAELRRFLEVNPVWMPSEGRFEPLLQPDFLAAFAQAGSDELIFVPEFPATDPVERLSLAQLRSSATPFPTRGTLLAPDHSFLFTVDWDSFFTLFYGSRAFITKAASSLNLEGFFAAATTEHTWFNYVMGCATVTLSPEHWQTV